MGVEGRRGGRRPPTTYPLLATHTCTRASARVRPRTRTQSCGRSLLRTRGDNKICDNQPRRRRRRRRRRRESVMTLSRTSFQATSVTLRAHLPLSLFSTPTPLPTPFPLSIPSSSVRLPLSIQSAISIFILIFASRRLTSFALATLLFPPPSPVYSRCPVQLTPDILPRTSCSHHYGVFPSR